jgi:hypothetical protein
MIVIHLYLQYSAACAACILDRAKRDLILVLPAISDIRELLMHQTDITL